MRTLRLIAKFCFGSVLISSVFGRTLNVPTLDYPTIQSAIDSSVSGDSIFVAEGTYAEALRIENESLTILGEVSPDSAMGNGVIIDPTPLDSSNFKACLVVTGGDSVKLSRLWFRNGEAMYNGRPPVLVGGIDNTDGSRILSLSDCRFDSVYCCIFGGGVVLLDSVRMYDSRLFALFRGDTTRFAAKGCVFHGRVPLALIVGWSGSSFVHCAFQNDSTGDMLHVGIDSILVSGCAFGPFTANCGNAVVIRAGSGTIVENSLFHDCAIGTSVLSVYQADCETILDPGFREPVIRNNVFRDNAALGCQGGYSLELHCDGGLPTHLATVEGNQFTDLQSQGVYATAIYAYQGAVTLHDNQFRNMLPFNTAAILSSGITPPETLMMRDNAFDSLGYAVRHASGQEATDARWNWWGDSSGPFHGELNPDGLGAQVDDDVLFDPWLVSDPDSSDTSDVGVERGDQVRLQSFTLDVYPNPFNSTLSISLDVPQYSDVTLSLYDLLGREVDVVYRGRLASSTISYVAPVGLASGVYFLRAAAGERSELVKVVFLK